jgi:stage III sporulation protein SpoIIIAA
MGTVDNLNRFHTANENNVSRLQFAACLGIRICRGFASNIAAYNGTPLRVVAGPGTGKTYALMRRVARMLEVEQVQPNRILVVTFTRTAANDLVEKLAQLGVPGADQVAAKRSTPRASAY